MNIAFCINSLALAGLGVTVSSLVRNCSNTTSLNIFFFCSKLSRQEKKKIEDLLQSENFKGKFKLVDFDPETYFNSFNSLHGDRTAYGRLLLADYINEAQVLYLDSDLVVEVDVLEVENFDFKGNILAAVGGGTFRYALGSEFYTENFQLSPLLQYFNSGVLLLNLQEWRLQNIKQKCIEIAGKYANYLPSHDQSLLNIICAGEFARLPSSFNCEWPSDRVKPAIAEKMILHFVGSPKPWDPLGFLIHKGYKTWKSYLNPNWFTFSSQVSLNNLKRAWNIRRSYIRSINNKIKSL